MPRPVNRLRTSLIAAGIATAAVVGVLVPARPASAGTTIIGAGSSFMALELDQWRARVATLPEPITVNYSSQGSTAGRNQFKAGQVDFGGSDIPYPAAELDPSAWAASERHDNFVYVPVSAGG